MNSTRHNFSLAHRTIEQTCVRVLEASLRLTIRMTGKTGYASGALQEVE